MQRLNKLNSPEANDIGRDFRSNREPAQTTRLQQEIDQTKKEIREAFGATGRAKAKAKIKLTEDA